MDSLCKDVGNKSIEYSIKSKKISPKNAIENILI